MKGDRNAAVWTGVGLIALGVAFGLATIIGWDRVWPIFPLGGGVALWLSYFLGGSRDGGLAFMGTGAVLIGLFFFGFTLGLWRWEDMERLWPVFPVIGGLAFLVLFVAERRTRRDPGVLFIGLAAIVVGVVAWAVKAGSLPADIGKYWPVLIILLGVVGLVSGLMVRGRRA